MRIKNWHTFNEGEYDVYRNSSGKKFWGDLGAGVLPIAKSTGRVLLGLRSKYVNEPHTWGVWGGMIDNRWEAQNPSKAALRELKEEAGAPAIDEIIPAYVFEAPGFKYYNFIGIVPDEFEPELDWETENYKWVDLDDLEYMDDKHFGLDALLRNSMDTIKKYAK